MPRQRVRTAEVAVLDRQMRAGGIDERVFRGERVFEVVVPVITFIFEARTAEIKAGPPFVFLEIEQTIRRVAFCGDRVEPLGSQERGRARRVAGRHGGASL
jgi:hypothetical protein